MCSQILPATAADLEDLNTVLNACAEAMDKQGMSHWLGVYNLISVQKNLQDKQVYKLVVDHQLIGCVALSHYPADYYADCWPDAPQADWYLTQLAVSPHYQGQRWGEFLVEFCLNQVQPASLYLDAVAHYPALLKFYQKLSFKIIAEGVGLGDKRYLFAYSNE